MEKETTIYDIAKVLGLSASTVSRALKGNPVINARTRAKVEECAQTMGYRSNAFASNLRTRRTNTIGVIVPRLDSSFLSACLAGMEEVASSEGYNLIISQSHESAKKEAQNALTMFNSRVDGVIASLTIENSDLSYFNRFRKSNVPVVFFDRIPNQTDSMCFSIDNEKASYEATKHLIDQGCRRLIHVTIKSHLDVYNQRIAGFSKAVEEFPECIGNVIYVGALSLEGGNLAAMKIIESNNIPDGVFVANDMAAVGCMTTLMEHGYKFPDDIAMVGFNNDPVATIISPALTTVNYPGREAGMLAAKKLINLLNGEKDIESTHNLILNANLVIRNSSLKKKILHKFSMY